MTRVRILFSKRGLSCFISHSELPRLFSRAARRAGIEIELTQGFSPHPRMSLGPALAVGVVGLAEPVDFWLSRWSLEFLEAWNAKLPLGFCFEAAVAIPDETPSLSRSCLASEFLVGSRTEGSRPLIADTLRHHFSKEGDLLLLENQEPFVRICLTRPEIHGAGALVETLVEAGLAFGWQDLKLVRCAVGIWDGRNVVAPFPEERG